jgi:hypothetical protein
MQSKHKGSLVLRSAVILIIIISGCQTEKALTPDQEIVTQKTYELFTRIKVHDYAVIYENEFQYLKEEADIEQFLDHPVMEWYKTDTLLALQVDSVTAWADSAYAHLQLEYVLADSTLSITAISLRWHYSNDEWIKPTMSFLNKQLEFEDEIRMYMEAIQAKKDREAKKAREQEEDSDE